MDAKGDPISPKANTAWIGVDLGGTNCRLGLVDSSGLAATSHFRTRAERGPEDIIQRMAQAVRKLAGRARERALEVRGVGAACPGVIQRPRGVVSFAPNLPGWRGTALAEALASQTDLPTAVENDANLYALGEYRFGPWQGRDLACFTLGTGVGGGLVIQGRLVTGPLGCGGELGHLVVEPGGRPCPCGNRGCLEAYASAAGLKAMLGQELRAGRRSSLSPGDGVKRMAEAAGQGDRLARELFQRAGRALGRAFSLTATAAGLDLMVIGGGAAPAWPFMESQARIELSQNLHMVDPAAVELAQSRLGDDAPLLGAAAFAESTFATSAG